MLVWVIEREPQLGALAGPDEAAPRDPYGMRRPASLSAWGPYASWSSGAYAYDGAGNIKTIGASWFTYDKVSRLVTASLNDGPTGGGTQKQQREL
ncbi:MAG TPA: hypothetical protein VLE27_11190 [Thermoanaerobaculia bacterium]|nr:hypothetical protein [Thermoanaerobaculia bacterium]